MEPLTLKTQQPSDNNIETWDDDGDFEGFDDIQVRTASSATSSTAFSAANLASSEGRHHSISSRLSTRSDIDSNQGDEDWQVLLPDDDNATTKDAIAVAKSKGIPIPTDVPKSALEGGTIRRLGGKKIKKALGDDWSEDLELPGLGGELKLAQNDKNNNFPATLRQISAAFRDIPSGNPLDAMLQAASSVQSKPDLRSLDQFKDNADDEGFDDVPTIKVAKSRTVKKSMPSDGSPSKPEQDDIENDLEIPPQGELKLASRKETPQTPQQDDDMDLDWADGSLGTRYGGTKRELRSDRSSSVSASALSPSVSSCLTAESEDEGLDCLILPSGPLKLDEALKKRQQTEPSDGFDGSHHQTAAQRAAAKNDFFADFEIGDGDVFDTAKLTLNRNIQHKIQRAPSPHRRTATTLTFTNTKSQPASTRIPRPNAQLLSRDKPRSTLETVSETGPAAARFTRSGSRLSGHSPQSSVSAIPAPSVSSTPSTPSRRDLRRQGSRENIRTEPVTTTSAQLLRSKRSMPVMRGLQSPTKQPPFPRPPSRNEMGGTGSRLNMVPRPKTPTDRTESRLAEARRPAPFRPAGPKATQTKQAGMKTSTARSLRRHESGDSADGSSGAPRPLSRLTQRPETPTRGQRGRNVAPAELTLAAKKTMTKPARGRNFGDGTELETFDDLPTSATAENKFVKQPIGRGAPRSLRNKLGQSHLAPSTSSLASRTETPMPSTPLSPTKQMIPPSTPRFARETTASRNAREQRTVSGSINATLREPPPLRESRALAPLSTNWKGQLVSRTNANPHGLASPSSFRRKRAVQKEQQKPQLIKPLGSGVNEAKSCKGMQYNPTLFRWEGNENALSPFDVPPSHTSAGGSPSRSRDGHSPKHSSTGQPALITNVGQMGSGVQVVGGMVFDPSRMCWLKMAPSQSTDPGSSPQVGLGSSGNAVLRGGAASVGSVQLEEEEDVFAGLEDLKEEDESTLGNSRHGGDPGDRKARQSLGANRSGDVEDYEGDAANNSGDEAWPVSEEFDVGPEFIRRQRNEEEKWRRKVEKWLRPELAVEDRERSGWRWTIRDVVSGLSPAP